MSESFRCHGAYGWVRCREQEEDARWLLFSRLRLKSKVAMFALALSISFRFADEDEQVVSSI